MKTKRRKPQSTATKVAVAKRKARPAARAKKLPPKWPPILLTVNSIKNLQPSEAVYEQPDTLARGMRLVVQPTGGKSFAVRYWDKLHRKRAKLTLGRWPDLSLSDARSLTSEVRSAVAKSQNPMAVVRPTKPVQAPVTGMLVEAAWRRYQNFCRDVRKLRASTLNEGNRIMSNDVLPAWHGRTLDQITPDDVLEIVNKLLERGAPIGANRVLAVMTTFFNWTVAQRILRTDSPCRGLKKPSPQYARERVLTPDEIKLLWQTSEAMGNPLAAVFKLLLITAARRGEIGGMAWSEINLPKRTWTLPAERSKNRKALELPLPDLAFDILKHLPHTDPLVFGFTNGSWYWHKYRIDKALPDLKPWTWHDLRRSAVTHMIEEVNAAPHVVEAICNHVSGHRSGVAGVYNKAPYREQMKRTLDAWCAYLDRLTTGRSATVVPLGRA